ncbi:MAG: LLM class flavin-dependent oxidoreductase [Mycobacteriales bacterium]
MITSLRLNNDLPVHLLVDIAVAAEAGGFEQVWVSNDLFLRSAPVILTQIAAATRTIRFGTGILNPYSMHPAEIAMLAATLQEVSGGRFLLGIAAGDADFLGWAGIDRPRPLSRTREAIVAIRTLLDGGRPGAPGWAEQAHLRCSPAPTPIYVGAMSPKMLAMAGEYADGVLALLYPPEHFSVAREQVAAGVTSAGRHPAEVDVPACVWCSVDQDPGRARRALADKIAYYGASFAPYLLARAGLRVADFAPVRAALEAGDADRAAAMVTPKMLRLGIAGSPQDVIDRCRGLIDLGATHLSFGPPLGPDPVAAVDLLGRAVVPALRGA